MFDTVLIADAGASALHVVQACERLGIRAISVHSDADSRAAHATEADESVLLGTHDSYGDHLKLVEAAKQTGAQAVHPGASPLADDAAFARAVVEAGLAWVGPPAEAIELMNERVRPAPAPPTVDVHVLGRPDGRVVPLAGAHPAACAIAEAAGYRGLGTLGFAGDVLVAWTARLPAGLDVVEKQLRVAAGEDPFERSQRT